jgi:hypothetical protein
LSAQPFGAAALQLGDDPLGVIAEVTAQRLGQLGFYQRLRLKLIIG